MRTDDAIGHRPSAIGRWFTTLRRLFGMPDYARYTAHQHRCHPGEPVQSEKEFIRAELERKYAEGGGRCC